MLPISTATVLMIGLAFRHIGGGGGGIFEPVDGDAELLLSSSSLLIMQYVYDEQLAVVCTVPVGVAEKVGNAKI